MKEVESQDHNQAMSDLQILCEKTLQNSTYFVSDKLKIANNMLLSRILQAISLHGVDIEDIPDNVESLTASVIEKISARVVEISTQSFADLFKKYFLDTLQLLTFSSSDPKSMGKAWLLSFLGFMMLYVPNLPFDPAIRQHVEYDCTRNLTKQYEEMRKSWECIKSVFVGCSNVDLDSVWETRLPQLQNIVVPSVYRPEISQIGFIHDEWVNLINSSIGKDVISPLIDNDILSVQQLEQVKTIQRNTAEFIGRSESNNQYYSDITSIFHGIIYGLKLGLDLITLPVLENEVSPYFLINPVNLSQTEQLHNSFTSYKESIKSLPSNSSEKVLLTLLSAVDIIVKTEGKTSSKLDEIVSFAYQTFYYKWSLNRIRIENEAASKTTIFNDTTEEDADKDFMRMFPDYEEVVEIDSNGINQDEDYSQLMDLYLQSFGEGSSVSLQELCTVGTESLQLVSKDDSSKFITQNVSSILPSILMSMSVTLTGQKLGNDNVFDFYHQAKPDETVKVSKLAVRLKTQISKFLEMWPEHATLQSIQSACEDILSFPMSTPVARYLQKVEQLYTYVDEWEKFTSRDYTVKPIFNEMTELIVSWRRLELSTWPKLFEVEELALKKEIGKWWFYLFENLIENPSKVCEISDETTYPTIVQTLTIFISQSTYGQFSTRLRLLRAFAKHTRSMISAIPSMSIVSECISNVANYYSQYSTQISNHILNGKKSLQKEINEVILLASWKDTNISALRESAKKSHTKLYKVLRKYRTLISESVEPIVKAGMEQLSDTPTSIATTLAATPGYKSVSQYLDGLKTLEIWKQRPARLINVDGTAKLLHSHLISIKEETLPSIETFAQDIVQEMERLRKETPAVLNENNKSTVSNLKNEKSKLLSSTLKELRRGGLKTNVRADIKAQQLLVSGIMATVPSFTDKSVGSGDKYFYRILDLLPRLRVSVTESESDAPIADLTRGLAMSENLLAVIINHRSYLNTLLNENFKVKFLLDVVNSFTGLLDIDDRVQVVSEFNDVVSHTKATVSWVPKIMKFAIESCYQSSNLGKIKYTNETLIFSETEARFKDLAVRLDKFSDFNSIEVMTQSLSDLLFSVRSELESLVSSLSKWQVKYPKLAFIGEMVASWAKDRISLSLTLTQAKHDIEYTLADLNKILCNICDSVLVLVQKGREIMQENISQETDNWLQLSQSRLINYCRALRQQQFSEKIQKAIEITKYIASSANKADFQTSLRLLSAAIPFMHEYHELCSIVESKMLFNFTTTNKGAFILMRTLQNLAQNGFCSPQEEQSNEEDSGATKDGTGLGDGSGAQNNSNDVEDDEDLSEHAQKDNEDQNKDEKNDEEDDNAVDIEGDMGAGELEDASDQDKSDEEDNDDDDENELDEEVGDVDDLDPNAVDEKMWDEKGEDNDKEKKSDKVPEGANDDDMQAKEEENETEDGKDPKNSEDGNNDNEQDDDAEEEEDVAEQEDNVNQQEKEDLEPEVPETDTLELPEDMNLDGDDDEDDKGDDNDQDDVEMPDVEDENFEGGEEKEGSEEVNKQDGMDADSEAEKEGEEEEEDQEVDNDAMDLDENPGDDNDDVEKEEDSKIPEEEAVQPKPEEGEDAEVSKETENDMKFDTEGLHGPDQADEEDTADNDENAVTQEQSTNQGEGNEQSAEQEQENMETSGGQSSAKPEEDQEKTEEKDSEDQARKDVEKSMKQLGDALKEFHKRKQEIKEASEKDESADQGANERPDEFEHIDSTNSSAQDTQALGAASQDQVQKIDDSKAIEDDEEVQNHEEPEAKEVDELEKMETDETEPPAGQESSDLPQTAGSVVGERKKNEEIGESLAGEAMDLDDESADIELDSEENFEVAESGFEPARSLEDARELWRDNETITQESAMALCEQLRLILEPTQATKLRGDFKTGKRLNMKRIIPYIASQFKKDKIWMRRTKPSKRQYQVMIAVDDSKSMSESQSVKLAFQSIALISKALTQLEAGQLSIARFGETTQLVHPFEKPFSSESGAHALQWFGFEQERTDVRALVEKSIRLFEEAGVGSAASHNAAELWRLEIIISDGVCEDHDTLRRLVRRAREERIMMVFVIVDGLNNHESILDLNEVSYQTDDSGNMNLKIDRYLDHFPFDFYVIVKDVRELPNVLSLVLRQFFAEVAETSS